MASWAFDSGDPLLPDIDGANNDNDDKQLLRLTICQALQSQYVMEHTRVMIDIYSYNIYLRTIFYYIYTGNR